MDSDNSNDLKNIFDIIIEQINNDLTFINYSGLSIDELMIILNNSPIGLLIEDRLNLKIINCKYRYNCIDWVIDDLGVVIKWSLKISLNMVKKSSISNVESVDEFKLKMWLDNFIWCVNMYIWQQSLLINNLEL